MATKNKKNTYQVNHKKKIIIGGTVAVVLVAAIVGVTLIYQNRNKSTKESVAADGAGYDYQKSGDIKLGTYHEIVVNVEPTDDEIQGAIEDFCSEHSVKKDAVVAKGSTINIDYTGTIDGTEFDGGSSEDESLTVGDYEYFEDFEDGLIGKKVGTTVDVPVTFPSDYDDDSLKGKQAVFSIKINSMDAEFTDATVKSVTKGKYTTTKAYKEKVKADLKKENKECANDTAWDQLKEATTLNKVPDGVQKLAEADTNQMYEQFAAIQGLEVSELLEQLGMSEDDVPEMATDMAKERMIAKTIAILEGVTLDDAFYKKALTDAVGDEDSKTEVSIADLEKTYKENQSSRPKDDMLIEKVKEYIGESVKISEQS